jgi:hypothetical protein
MENVFKAHKEDVNKAASTADLNQIFTLDFSRFEVIINGLEERRVALLSHRAGSAATKGLRFGKLTNCAAHGACAVVYPKEKNRG